MAASCDTHEPIAPSVGFILLVICLAVVCSPVQTDAIFHAATGCPPPFFRFALHSPQLLVPRQSR